MTALDEARAFFVKAPLCFLATTGDDAPNVVPIGYKWLFQDGLLLADLYFGRTRANLLANPLVAVSVATEDPKHGYQFKGRATVHRQGVAYEELCRCLAEEGVDATPHAAVTVAIAELYLLDPGPTAGESLL